MTDPDDPDPADEPDDRLFDLPADEPVTPYAGSSGWSGSETSKDRADRADTSGLTGHRDRFTLEALKVAAADGITWGELADAHALHHGEASAALSRLHRVGLIRRLTKKRGRSQIYVLPEHVAGRPTSPYRPNLRKQQVVDLLDMVDDLIATSRLPEARRQIALARRLWSAKNEGT